METTRIDADRDARAGNAVSRIGVDVNEEPSSGHDQTTNSDCVLKSLSPLINTTSSSATSSSTRQCWLQLWVSCTVVRRCCGCTASSVPTTNVQTRLDEQYTVWYRLKLGLSRYRLSRYLFPGTFCIPLYRYTTRCASSVFVVSQHSR